MKIPFTLENRDKIESAFLDQIEIRNNSKVGSARHINAIKNAEAIEQAFSIILFRTTDKSFSECIEQLDSNS